MRTTPVSIAAGTTTEINAPFFARSVLIDNPGGQWVTLLDLPYYVPPFTTGAVVPLPGGTQRVRVSTLAPAGQLNSGVGNAARVQLSDEHEVPSAGAAYGANLTLQVPDNSNLIIDQFAGPAISGAWIDDFSGFNGQFRLIYFRVSAIALLATAAPINIRCSAMSIGASTNPAIRGTMHVACGNSYAGTATRTMAPQAFELNFNRDFQPVFTLNPGTNFRFLAEIKDAVTYTSNVEFDIFGVLAPLGV